MEDFEKLYNKALRFLSYRPRSEKEVRDYLVRHSGEEDRWNRRDSRHSLASAKASAKESQNDAMGSTIEKIITKLKEQKFLNDEDFAKWWVEQRSAFKTKSIRLIKMELQQKGVDKSITDRIIQNSEFRIQNDLERAKTLVEKRIERFRNLSKHEIYQKLGSYLARRGFDWETIKQSIDEVLEKKV